MRTQTMMIVFLVGLGLLRTTGDARAQNAVPPFVPGDLVIGYKSADDADAALAEMKGAASKVRVRGVPAEGVQAKKVLDTTLSIHIDLPASIAATVRGNPASELSVLEEIAAGIKASDQRVSYAHPNWIRRINPPPEHNFLGKSGIVPESLKQQSPQSPSPANGTRNFIISQDGPDQSAGVPNDPLFPLQWDYLAPPHGMNAIGAWKTTKGSNDIVVAVIDTGILPDQPDIAPSGHVLPGYNFVTKSLSGCPDERDRGPGATDPGDDRPLCRSVEVNPGDKLQPSYHGSHVAGTIGAAGTNDGLGIAGVAWNVTILPVRVLGPHGGADTDIIQAMLWAAGYSVPGVPDNDHPADIINMSLAGPLGNSDGTLFPCDATTDPDYIQAIDLVRKKGAVIVVAAGNGEYTNKEGKLCKEGSQDCEDKPVDFKYEAPAGCPGVISVAASDMHGDIAWYSNFGAVSIMAPGGNVDDGAVGQYGADGKLKVFYGSAVRTDGKVFLPNIPYGGVLSTVKSNPVTGYYDWYQGTSMAAPHVSGALVLALAARPELRHHPDLVEQALRAAVVPPPNGACPPDKPCGPGMLDAARLVAPLAANQSNQ